MTSPGARTLKSLGSFMDVSNLAVPIFAAILTKRYTVMPAKTMLFDQRVRSLHDFGPAFCNFISFNPQGRLIAIAGFGNLAGKVDIYDRRTLTKVTTIDASNTSHCEWSPDGRFLLTATLSPRLRVDNGIKIWHCTGPLVHVQPIEELYQTSWRPTLVDVLPAFPPTIPPAPAPAASVEQHATVAKPTPSRAAGAYRPPGARGLEASSAYKREDDAPSGGSTPNGRFSRSPAPGRFQNGKRHVPGAPTSPSPVRHAGDQDKRGRKKKGPKENKKDALAAANGNGIANGEASARPSIDIPPVNGDVDAIAAANGEVPPTPGADLGLDPAAKKVRNLNKKVCTGVIKCLGTRVDGTVIAQGDRGAQGEAEEGRAARGDAAQEDRHRGRDSEGALHARHLFIASHRLVAGGHLRGRAAS